MAALGLPILGDRIYPNLLPQGGDKLDNPLRLLAESIAFRDPVNGMNRSFTSRQNCIANFPVEEKLYIGAGGILSRRQIRAIVRAIDRIETFGNVRDFMRVASGGRRG